MDLTAQGVVGRVIVDVPERAIGVFDRTVLRRGRVERAVGRLGAGATLGRWFQVGRQIAESESVVAAGISTARVVPPGPGIDTYPNSTRSCAQSSSVASVFSSTPPTLATASPRSRTNFWWSPRSPLRGTNRVVTRWCGYA